MRRFAALAVALVCLPALAERVPPGTDDDIRERMQPFGEVCVAGGECGGAALATADAAAGGSSAGVGKSGEEIYNTFCFACHAAGVGGAPKLGDAAEWAPRLDQGMDAMWQTTLNGRGAMPPKGTCMACSDDELKSAIDYMSGS